MRSGSWRTSARRRSTTAAARTSCATARRTAKSVRNSSDANATRQSSPRPPKQQREPDRHGDLEQPSRARQPSRRSLTPTAPETASTNCHRLAGCAMRNRQSFKPRVANGHLPAPFPLAERPREWLCGTSEMLSPGATENYVGKSRPRPRTIAAAAGNIRDAGYDPSRSSSDCQGRSIRSIPARVAWAAPELAQCLGMGLASVAVVQMGTQSTRRRPNGRGHRADTSQR